MVVSEQIFLAEILLMDMRFLLFVQCSNRSRGWGFALRPCLRNVRDMHWTGPRCPCKMMVFVIQNSEFLSLAKSVIQNSDYLIVRCMCHWIHLLGRWTKMNSWNLLQVERRRWSWTGDWFLPRYHHHCLLNWLDAWPMPLSAHAVMQMFAQDMRTDPSSIISPLQSTQSNREGLQQRGVAYYCPSLSESGLLCNNWWGRSATSSKLKAPHSSFSMHIVYMSAL